MTEFVPIQSHHYSRRRATHGLIAWAMTAVSALALALAGDTTGGQVLWGLVLLGSASAALVIHQMRLDPPVVLTFDHDGLAFVPPFRRTTGIRLPWDRIADVTHVDGEDGNHGWIRVTVRQGPVHQIQDVWLDTDPEALAADLDAMRAYRTS